jgi:glucose-1-phosphate cytidylyltransferase
VKVVILAGGFGTRLSEYTEAIPKPMVSIGGRPILWHIMSHFAHYGHREFILALGYKSEMVRDYFTNFQRLNSDLTVEMSTGEISVIGSEVPDWKVTMIDTGLHTQTGGRLRRLSALVGDGDFFLTYGDGVSDVDLDKLVALHRTTAAEVTITAVRPTARFGELEINGDVVSRFSEKPRASQGWINGGFFVMSPDFLQRIGSDDTILEKEPLEAVTTEQKMSAFQHEGFWQCMDTKRDRDLLQGLWESGNPPWTI